MSGGSGSNPSSSGGPGLFGQTGSSGNNQQATSIFGSSAQTSSTGGTNLFGGSSASTLFGNTKSPQSQTTSSTSLFGNPSGGSGGSGFSFASLGDKKTEDGAPKTTFGGFATPNKNDSSPKLGNNLFGSQTAQLGSASQPETTTPTAPKPTFSFGNPSTTPAGPPPSNMFGGLGQSQKSNGSNLFGSTQNQPQSANPASEKSSSLFTIPTNPSTTSQSSSTPLFGSSQASSTPTLFGKTPESSAQQQPKEAPKFSFGNLSQTAVTQQPSNGDGSKSADQSTSKPTFSFPSLSTTSVQKPDQQTTGSSATEKNGGGSASPNIFGNINQSKDTAKPSTSAAPTLFGNLTQPKETTEQPKQPASLFGSMDQKKGSEEQTQAPSLFGVPSSKPDKEASTPTSTTTTVQQAQPALFPTPASSANQASSTNIFGNANKSASDAEKPKEADKTKETSTQANLGASTIGPAPTPQSRLKNKSMDEIVTRWASDLSKYQKEFQSQAEKVASWDRMLLENSNAISKLYSKTYQAERDTAEVQKQLSIVESHQDELSHWLDRYEREVDEMMTRQVGQGEGLQGPDQERERTYKVAERVSERLDEMGKDLTSMIDEINDASATISKTSRPDDPLSQIVRVLNGHLSQLQLIDQGAAELQAKVNAAQKESQRLESRGSAIGGYGNGDAADHFYRSYMRRG